MAGAVVRIPAGIKLFLWNSFIKSRDCSFLFLWNSSVVSVLSNTLSQMAPPEEVEALMNEIRLWCEAQRGRQKQLAQEFGVSEQVMSNWLNKRKTPSLKYWLQLQAFAKRMRRRR